jgi:spore coat protein U-like protein
MNKLLAALLTSVTLLAATIPTTQAATVAQNFNVTVTLNSVCTMAAVGDLAFGTYTAFQGAAATGSTSAVLTCTRGMTGITAAFDTGVDASSSASITAPTGAGVVAGLNYTLSTTQTATSAGTAATTASIGTAATWTYAINGNMPANQAGTCTTTTCAGTQARTFTVTY